MAEKVPIREGIFTESSEGVRLLASKCNSCGQVHFPGVQLCLNCISENLEVISLSQRGKLYSYTISRVPSAHFEPPYAVGFIDLAEGVRVFSPLDMVEDRPFKVGMEMEARLETLWQEGDKQVVGYRFSPV